MVNMQAASVPEVFEAAEVARAAGVSAREVRALIANGQLETVDGYLIAPGEAVRAVRRFRDLQPGPGEPRAMFQAHEAAVRAPGRAIVASGTLHAAMLGMVVMLTTMGVASAPHQDIALSSEMRLVFLATPGPGGGGGGGGLKQPAPPPKAELKGTSTLRSPVPPRRPVAPKRPEPKVERTLPPPPVRPRPVEQPVEPPPAPAAVPAPQVVAPVATAAADARDRAGVLTESASTADSNGAGTGGGVGSGRGTGIGEGDGSGIGPGSGGGTGGGPYRPGSGIVAPSLLREVKPDYTEAARRGSIEGDVVLEIVVRRDGSVGDIKIMQGLGAGLDERAVEAVRQWRFSPARRFGTPVDVIVEVAVEFKLR
jgi:TonB family protein